VLLSLVWREPHFRETLRYTIQGIAMVPIFYYVVSAPESWLGRTLAWQPLRWLGWVSYTMYLCHFMVLDLMHDYLGWNWWLVGVLALAVAGAFAELVRQGIEKPLRQLKRRKP
jgi:peptidoglycan/LPS O-acetylase OafA/YrhL